MLGAGKVGFCLSRTLHCVFPCSVISGVLLGAVLYTEHPQDQGGAVRKQGVKRAYKKNSNNLGYLKDSIGNALP